MADLSMLAGSTQPRLSVVIPTYNRCDILRHTLEALAAQRFPHEDFEVVVADDGSADGTAEMVRSFQATLRLRYHFQEDFGFRAATARNAGARLTTAPVLVFMDSGTVAGPDFVSAHLAAHADGQSRAIAGETYGYRPTEPTPGLAEAIAACTPEEVRRQYDGVPSFADIRDDGLAQIDFDMTRMQLPWSAFWGTNISVRAADFWAAGGFDEDFRTWGSEDIELGYRLYRRAIELAFSREAWAIETPHARSTAANMESNQRNVLMFLVKHRDPIVELFWGCCMRRLLLAVEYQCWALRKWTREAHCQNVRDELASEVRGLPKGARVAIFGCGAELPDELPDDTVVLDFDRELLDKATANGRHIGHHAIGLRTPLPPCSVDVVVVSSRLRGLWAEWSGEILAEAHRIGRRVCGSLAVTPS